jgi:prepilin-type N-terminal cleavage/methylation domain-containing protein
MTVVHRPGAVYRRQGFTLIELLVVIAIISILASMLIPALARAKSQALVTRCLSNQRQVSLGLQMFADDHHGMLPGSDSIAGGGVGQLVTFRGGASNLPPSALVRLAYLPNSQVFVCPETVHARRFEQQMNEIYGWKVAFHYKFNVDFVGTKLSESDSELPALTSSANPRQDDPAWRARRLTDAALQPAHTILGGDCVGATDVTSTVGSPRPNSPSTIFFSAAHGMHRRTIVQYADGHVERTEVLEPIPEFFYIGGVPTQ